MAFTCYLADPKFLPWGLLNMSSRQQEYEETEKPLLDQLQGEPDDPDETGLDGRRELLFYRKLKEQMEIGEALEERSREYIETLAEETRSLVELIADEIDRIDFWESAHYQEQLRRKIMRKLARSRFGIDGDLGKLGDDLVTMASRNRDRLVKPD